MLRYITYLLLAASITIPAQEKVTVAVMEIEVSGNDFKKTAGVEIVDLINAYLSTNEKVTVVERKKLDELLKEQAASEAGFTEKDTRIKVQKLYGVKYFISGRLFSVGSSSYLSVSLISTETSLKKTVLAKSTARTDYSTLAEDAGAKLITKLKEISDKAEGEKKPDYVRLIKEDLKGLKLPKVAVHIAESHISQALPDPAAEVEMIEIMRKVGINVIQYKSKVKSEIFENGVKEITADLKDVDILVLGEGVSQFALRKGELISCKARMEIKALRVKDDQLLAINNITSTGIDVSEMIASKEALQSCSRDISREFIVQMVKKWNQL